MMLRSASSITNQIIHSPHLRRLSTAAETTAQKTKPQTSTLKKTAKVFWFVTKLTIAGGIIGPTAFGLLGAKSGYLEGKNIVAKSIADGKELSPQEIDATISLSIREGIRKGFDEGLLKGLLPITLLLGTWNRLNK
ncbi:MAG: hypothetical protein JSS09_06375 [Verrucomicrobia bacterium]|nr:hypothetical protein [Verrucomicrobiota bacterium]